MAADQLGQPEVALEALARALKEEPAAGGALDDLERISRAAKLPGLGAAKIEEALAGAEPDAALELALRAAALYQEAAQDKAAERPLSPRPRSRTPRTPTRSRRSRGSIAPERRRPSWPRCSSDDRLASSTHRSGSPGCSRRRGFTRGRGI